MKIALLIAGIVLITFVSVIVFVFKTLNKIDFQIDLDEKDLTKELMKDNFL